MTIAARECDSYQDIRANLARNNIMESLQDLGADTLYESGDQVDPRTELEGQPKCRPIVGWRFTFGSGYVSRAVDGPWGSLSIVTEPDSFQPVTEASIPLRDFDGNPVSGDVQLRGAVTVGLTGDQVDRASQNRLWLQGGTTTDPDLYADPAFAGRYGFGALRCAIDDLNGDNVETIQFPTSARHQFCYAYYVTPPPSSGTIVIRKVVEGSSESQTFHYSGNLSYNEGGAFDLAASDASPGSTEFVRGETRTGEPPWTVVETAQEGWTLTALSCTSQSSVATTDVATGTARITLAAGDTVTCTYTNRLTPPAGAVVLRKVTINGTGRFPFTVSDPTGRVIRRQTLATQAQGGVGAATVIKLDPGRYRITEQLPVSTVGEWRLASVVCNGRGVTARPVTVEVEAGRGAVCTFTNRLDLLGAINVAGVSLGGLGSAWYVTSPAADAATQRRQLARTTRQGVPTAARGDSTQEIPFGRYSIQQSAALGSSADDWTLVAVQCNNRLLPFAQGRVTVRISRATPVQNCRFVNLRQRPPEPPDPDPTPTPTPPAPEPTPPPEPAPVPGEATPDLAVTKALVSSTSSRPPVRTFRVRVTNRSAFTASRVVLADRLDPGTVYVSARPSQGSCTRSGDRLVICVLGDLAPGASATVTVRVQQIDPNAGVNVAVTGSGTPEDVLRNNADAARYPAFRAGRIVCGSASSVIARAAC